MMKFRKLIIAVVLLNFLTPGCARLMKESDMSDSQAWGEWLNKIYVFKDRELNTRVKRVALVGFIVMGKQSYRSKEVIGTTEFIRYFTKELTSEGVSKFVEAASDVLTLSLKKTGMEVLDPKVFVNNSTYQSLTGVGDSGLATLIDTGYITGEFKPFSAYGLKPLYYMGTGPFVVKNFDDVAMGKFMEEMNLDAVIIGNYSYLPIAKELVPYLSVLVRSGTGKAERAFLFGLTKPVGWDNNKNEPDIDVMKHLLVSSTRLLAAKMTEKLTAQNSGPTGWQQGE